VGHSKPVFYRMPLKRNPDAYGANCCKFRLRSNAGRHAFPRHGATHGSFGASLLKDAAVLEAGRCECGQSLQAWVLQQCRDTHSFARHERTGGSFETRLLKDAAEPDP
jgi:hypothetical protein